MKLLGTGYEMIGDCFRDGRGTGYEMVRDRLRHGWGPVMRWLGAGYEMVGDWLPKLGPPHHQVLQ